MEKEVNTLMQRSKGAGVTRLVRHSTPYSLTLMFGVLIAVAPLGAQSPTANFTVSSAVVSPGATIELGISLQTTVLGHTGCSFGVSFPTNVLQLAGGPSLGSSLITFGSLITVVPASEIAGGPLDGLAIAVIYGGIGATVVLPPGTPAEVVTITFEVSPSAPPGSYPVTLRGDLFPNGAPPQTELLAVLEQTQEVSPPSTFGSIIVEGVDFLRGDANADGNISLLDVIFALRFLTGSNLPFPNTCLEAYDANGSGNFETIADPIYLLSWMFLGGSPPPAPFPSCGTSSTVSPGGGCLSFSLCP